MAAPARVAALAAFWLLIVVPARAGGQTMVHNGSFDEVGDGGALVGWQAFGRSDIEQRLTVAEDPERGKVARLTCTHFVPGSAASHAMVAQTDYVTVRRGQWYRLKLWARATDMPGNVVRVALNNCKVWGPAGLASSFLPSQEWQPFEFAFRASQDLAPDESRLQIWFSGTGTLCLDDVELVEAEPVRRRWRPVLPLDGVKNAIPNSSFECGGVGWGSWGPVRSGWGANLFRLMGEPDETRAFHGRSSWKLALSPETLPVRYFDYYQPLAETQHVILIGHRGWVPVERGKRYVFSAYVTADRAGLPVRIVVQEADGRRHEHVAEVGTDWQRVEVAFTADREFACGFVGSDLREVDPPEGTVWLDAVQFEQGEAATAYGPRQALESFVETRSPTGIVTDPTSGVSYSVSACNDSDEDVTLGGRLTVADYLDRVVREEEVSLDVPARGPARAELSAMAGRTGFFRLRWEPAGGPAQSVRAAVIEPSPAGETAYGFNHAFPWAFLIDLSHQAGMRWWRDWSVKWQTVQPEPDGFDFGVPDAQIDRVLAEGGDVLVLLPFPSAIWAAALDEGKIDREAGRNASLRERLPTAFKPERVEAAAWSPQEEEDC